MGRYRERLFPFLLMDPFFSIYDTKGNIHQNISLSDLDVVISF